MRHILSKLVTPRLFRFLHLLKELRQSFVGSLPEGDLFEDVCPVTPFRKPDVGVGSRDSGGVFHGTEIGILFVRLFFGLSPNVHGRIVVVAVAPTAQALDVFVCVGAERRGGW